MDDKAKIADRIAGLLDGAAGDGWAERVARLSELQEARRPGVLAHAERVAAGAVALAAAAGMNDRARLAELRCATLFHDVGKLSVHEAVLFKPGALTASERLEMQMHAPYGEALLATAKTPKVVLDVARYHHERYDGRGYFGLAGEDIPLAARIVAIVDVADALVAKREYKESMREAAALGMMTGTDEAPRLGRAAFDPFLLRRYVAMRLTDPFFEATPSERAALTRFASSDPMSDFPERPQDLVITRSGHRMRYDVHDGGCRTLVSMMRPDGTEVTDIPRRAFIPESAPAPTPVLGF